MAKTAAAVADVAEARHRARKLERKAAEAAEVAAAAEAAAAAAADAAAADAAAADAAATPPPVAATPAASDPSATPAAATPGAASASTSITPGHWDAMCIACGCKLTYDNQMLTNPCGHMVSCSHTHTVPHPPLPPPLRTKTHTSRVLTRPTPRRCQR
jgi:nucleoid-associated protein YgaU